MAGYTVNRIVCRHNNVSPCIYRTLHRRQMNVVKFPFSYIYFCCIYTAETVARSAVMLTAGKCSAFFYAFDSAFGKFACKVRVFGEKFLCSAPTWVTCNIEHCNKAHMVTRKLYFLTDSFHYFTVKLGVKGTT